MRPRTEYSRGTACTSVSAGLKCANDDLPARRARACGSYEALIASLGLCRGGLLAASPARRGRPTLPSLIPRTAGRRGGKERSDRLRARPSGTMFSSGRPNEGARRTKGRWPRARSVGARVISGAGERGRPVPTNSGSRSRPLACVGSPPPFHGRMLLPLRSGSAVHALVAPPPTHAGVRPSLSGRRGRPRADPPSAPAGLTRCRPPTC